MNYNIKKLDSDEEIFVFSVKKYNLISDFYW